MKIRTKVDRIEKKIQFLNDELVQLRCECKHPGLLGKYDADTGNWCSSDDEYWVDFVCPECGKKWWEWQELQEYRQGTYKSLEGFAYTKV